MDLSGNTVLVTGGASGIGLAIADRFLHAGSEVIVCGRREDKLALARASRPGLVTRVCDLGSAAERDALAAWAVAERPRLNVLVNNAGIQRRLALARPEPWEATREELAINLEAPIHLSTLLAPHLRAQERPAIVNVTSGLAFVPMAAVPIYCATKAAVHSFTLSLRHQLAATPIRVVEIIPPAVDTDLGGPGLHTFGVPLDEFADAAMARLAAGDDEIAYGFAAQSSRASRAELDAIFARMNQPKAAS
ncbi:MAG: SDR family oxidoreductase [Acidobacteriota bacterium]